MPVLQISNPLSKALLCVLIVFAMMTNNHYIIGLLAIVSLACLAYIAYISYYATMAIKYQRRKKHLRKENQKKSNEIFWNMYWLFSFQRRVLDLCLIYHVATTKLLLKFKYSEKATKRWRSRKTFEAFSEYMNFTILDHATCVIIKKCASPKIPKKIPCIHGCLFY